MSNEKRKILTLKRKNPEAMEEGTGSNKTVNSASTLQVPHVVGRKRVIVVTTPPAWKVKKQALASKVPSPDEIPPITTQKSVEKAVNKVVPRQVKALKGVKLIPLHEAISGMKTFWPELFDGEVPKLMAIGAFEKLVEDKRQNNYPISKKQIKRCLKSITRSKAYLRQTVVGAPRYNINGNAVITVKENEQQYAAERLKRIQS